MSVDASPLNVNVQQNVGFTRTETTSGERNLRVWFWTGTLDSPLVLLSSTGALLLMEDVQVGRRLRLHLQVGDKNINLRSADALTLRRQQTGHAHLVEDAQH